ncbi:MAG: helix-turn-helix transcriptional regulator [Lachnospiraceae bacterium]|nr:helix-turn-helix transcriptional regulator [Lachnospiraceae bacterium]
MVDFGNTLKRLRRKNDMTQEQLSRRLGLTKSVISAYETGMRMPSYDVLIAIARIFKVTTDFLLGVEQKQEVDFSGLTEAEKAAILNLIKAIKERQ